MITIERVAEIFGFTQGPWNIELSYISIVNRNLKIEICSFETGDANDEALNADMSLISKSPELLHMIVNDILRAEKNWIDNNDFSFSPSESDILEQCHRANADKIILIESCDRQGRKWPELRKELLK